MFEIEKKIVALWEDIAEARGFDRVAGTVISTLLIEGNPLSQHELEKKTGYSIPTISKTLKGLVSLGSVRRTKKAGKRVTLYYVEMHPIEMLSGSLTKWMLTARAMEQRIAKILQELEKVKHENPERAEKLMGVLKKFVTSIPNITEIIEKAIRDIQGLMGA